MVPRNSMFEVFPPALDARLGFRPFHRLRKGAGTGIRQRVMLRAVYDVPGPWSTFSSHREGGSVGEPIRGQPWRIRHRFGHSLLLTEPWPAKRLLLEWSFP